MLEKNYVLGAFTVDDFYFFFEEEAIKILQKLGKVTGIFTCRSNQADGKLLRLRLIVSVFKPNKKRLSTNISISFKKKIAHFYIVSNDFRDWFTEADEFMRDNGPSFRDGSTNVYITRATSKNHLTRKSELMNLIAKAD